MAENERTKSVKKLRSHHGFKAMKQNRVRELGLLTRKAWGR
jgi:hypothetical protein